MDAGALLRERRRAHGLSQHELAIRAGTRQATISRIEDGLALASFASQLAGNARR
jgi:transcriptional regulator with XRE-family HTH domain